MSGIITSFFIEPVVRQARRFSGVPQPRNAPPVETNNKNHLEDGPVSSASLFDLASGTESKQCARASSLDQHAQSHANSAATCSCSPPNFPCSSVTALGESSATHIQPHSSPCIEPPTTSSSAASERRSSLSLGQALFDRFAPLVATRHSPSAHQASRISSGTEGQAAAALLPGTRTHDIEPSNHSPVTHDTPDFFAQSHMLPSQEPEIMDRLNDNGRYSPVLGPRLSDTADEEMPRRIHQHSVTSRSEARRRRESAIEAAGSLSVAIKDKGASMTLEDEVEIRRRIQEIWKQPMSTQAKSRAMHLVLNEKYLASISERQQEKGSELTVSHTRPDSSSSFNSLHSSTISASDIEVFKRYNVAPEDLIPTLRPVPTHDECSQPRRSSSDLTSTPQIQESFSEDEDSEEGSDLGCEHYKRNIKIQCFECKTWWNCRYCHDEAQTGHKLPRRLTENMLCMLCQTPGPAGQYCTNCGEQAAYYYCDLCKLWDDDALKQIYHCSDCGICRIGMGLGKDFKHCKRCNVCIPIKEYDWHKCLERATDCDCPICGEYLFTSLSPAVSMNCGHYLHQSCYNEYMRNAYQCPICKKSARNMATQWCKLEEEIDQQPMPSNLRNISVDVRCNDCAGRSRVPFHWLGNKCELCDSFNTVEIELHRDSNGPGHSPSPPRGNWRNNARNIPQTRAPRYFQDDDEQTANASGNEANESTTTDSLLALPNTAYELLSNQFAAMRRNLSPIRRYLNAIEESPNAATEAEIERMGFWRFGSSPRPENRNMMSNDNGDGDDDEWEDEEDEEEEDDASSNSSDRGFLYNHDDSDSSSDSGLDIQLIGHR